MFVIGVDMIFRFSLHRAVRDVWKAVPPPHPLSHFKY